MASPGSMRKRITLIKPAPTFLNDAGVLEPDGSPIPYKVWVSWKESAGGERLSEEQEYGADTITIVFWWNSVFDDISIEWAAEDEKGNLLDIVSAIEVGGRKNQIQLKAVRRI